MAPDTVAPFAFAAALALILALVPLSTWVNRIVSRVAFSLFGDYVYRIGRHRTVRKRRLRQAHAPTTYRIYAAKTLLYASVAGVVGAVCGVYVTWGVLELLAVSPETVRARLPGTLHVLAEFVGVTQPTGVELLAVLLVICLALGVTAGAGTYYLRWWYPSHVAGVRKRKIEANMPQTIAFMYTLSRSGMALPKVLRILSDYTHIYGEPAEEVSVAVRNMDMFSKDMVTAIQTMGRRTPSPKFKEFSENLSSVLQSGQNLSEFLEKQHEEFQQEAEANQEQLLNQLATLAEVYVTLLVVLPLFLITILVVVGIAITDTLSILRTLVYLVFPVLNVGFILYLDAKMGESAGSDRFEGILDPTAYLDGVRRADDARPDGGVAADDRRRENVARLRLYRRIKWLHERFGDPLQTVVERPTALLWVTLPLVALVTLVRLYVVARLGIPIQVVVDDYLIQAALLAVGTFAIAYEIHERRIDTIEASVPDFLDRLASVNEAGMTVVESIDRVRRSDLGALNPELDRVWADLQWGADVETALRRFEHRVRTNTISRVVTLITNAISASGDLARVLRIAATQAKADRRLKRARQQEMLTYVVVVYVAFGVFLIIVAALDTVLIPNLPDSSSLPQTTGSAGQLGLSGVLEDLGTLNEAAYTLIFFHTTALQAMFSGLIAGQMSSGSVKDGAKHAVVLLSVAYLAFLLL
jgi:flagellar protein FlaJ